MTPVRKRAAEIRSRWNKNGIKCNLSLNELEPLFSVYFDTPQGKVVDLDKSKEITLDNIKSLSYAQYKTHKLHVWLYSQTKEYDAALNKYNQSVKISAEDIFQLISGQSIAINHSAKR